MLTQKTGGVDGGNVDARGSPGLHPIGPDPESGKLSRETMGRKFADPASFKNGATDEEPAFQEGPGRQNKRLRMKRSPCRRTDARKFSILKENSARRISVNI